MGQELENDVRVTVLHQGDARLADGNLLIRNAVNTKNELATSLRSLGIEHSEVLLDGHDLGFIRELRALEPDVVLNACDLGIGYAGGYEPHVAAILEAMRVAFTGSPSRSLALTNDKALWKQVLAASGAPTPRFVRADPGARGVPTCSLEPPVICKPLGSHNSLGIGFASVAFTREALEAQLAKIAAGREPYVIEQYIEGREIIGGFVGNGAARCVLPFEEIQYGEYFADKPNILTFEAKWDEASPAGKQSTVQIPAALSRSLHESLSTALLDIARIFDIRDYGRVDFRVDADEAVYAIDVNANPDISPCAGLFKMASHTGMSYREFIGEIVDSAVERGVSE